MLLAAFSRALDLVGGSCSTPPESVRRSARWRATHPKLRPDRAGGCRQKESRARPRAESSCSKASSCFPPICPASSTITTAPFASVSRWRNSLTVWPLASPSRPRSSTCWRCGASTTDARPASRERLLHPAQDVALASARAAAEERDEIRGRKDLREGALLVRREIIALPGVRRGEAASGGRCRRARARRCSIRAPARPVATPSQHPCECRRACAVSAFTSSIVNGEPRPKAKACRHSSCSWTTERRSKRCSSAHETASAAFAATGGFAPAVGGMRSRRSCWSNWFRQNSCNLSSGSAGAFFPRSLCAMCSRIAAMFLPPASGFEESSSRIFSSISRCRLEKRSRTAE